MAQAANQLHHQMQRKQQHQIPGNAGVGGGMMPPVKNETDPFHMERPQPTKAQLTMPPSLHHNKINVLPSTEGDKSGITSVGPLSTNSPLSLSPLGPMGGPSSLFGGLSHLSPPGCHMQVTL